MPHRITHVLDTVVIAVSTICTAMSSLIILAEAPSDIDAAAELRFLLLPLIGAMLSTGGMILMNPNPETRRIVIGRAIFGLFAGAVGPQLIAMVHPSLGNMRPALLLGLGFLIAGVAYALSKPFTRELYSRADRIAATEAARLEERFAPPVATTTVTVTEVKPAPIQPPQNPC